MTTRFGKAFGRLVAEKRGKTTLSQGELGKLVFPNRANRHEDVLKQDVSKLETGKIAKPTTRIIEQYRAALQTLGHPITDEEMALARTEKPAADPAIVSALLERNAALGRELHLKDKLVEGIVRNYAPGDWQGFDAALVQIEAILRREAEQRAQPKSNQDSPIDLLRKQVGDLNDQQMFDKGQTAIATAIAEEKAAGNARLFALYAESFSQAARRNDPELAAQNLVDQLLLDNPPDPFNALRALFMEWYEHGRDQGLAFDATVAIHIAEHSFTRAQTPDQRGMALNDLGIALQTLGEREPGTARLDAAVLAYTAALQEFTRDRVPLEWAGTQMNLGNALAALGEREPGTARLGAAVLAFTEALKECTRERVPFQWATLHMNLGNALCILGEREDNAVRIGAAVVVYEEALKEFTRDRMPQDWAITQVNLGAALLTLGKREHNTARFVAAASAQTEALKEFSRDRAPLDWALAQMNLGNALSNLGQHENGTARLEAAVQAFTEALKEFTRDRLPLDWAMVQGNLATVEIVYFDKTADPSHLATARTFALAAREVFVAAQAEHYVQKVDEQLAEIAARTP